MMAGPLPDVVTACRPRPPLRPGRHPAATLRPARHTAPTLALAFALATACGGEGGGRPAVVVRDSAGVHIVESTAPAWPDRHAWQVAPEPTVRIGVVEGDSAYQLYQVQAIDLPAEGGVLVLDGGSRQLRRYDAAGRHLWSAGGPGRGPGQFQRPFYLGRRADSLYVWDRALARLTVLTADGRLVRTEPHVSASGDAPMAYGIFADGALLVTVPHSIAPPAPGSVFADTVGLWRFDPATEERRLLTRLPGPLWLWTGRYQLPVPFTANPLRVVDRSRLLTAAGVVPEIRVYPSDGGPAARYILPRQPVAVTHGEVRRMVDDWIEHKYYGAPAAVWNEWLDRMPVPDRQPAFDRLLVDRARNLWARRFLALPDSTTAPVWDVLQPDGTYLGAVATPLGLEVMAIGTDTLAGVQRDSLDVEHVLVYRITGAGG